MKIDIKAIYKLYFFDFPWLLTAIHSLMSGIGAYMALYIMELNNRWDNPLLCNKFYRIPSLCFTLNSLLDQPITRTLAFREHIVMFVFSLLYTSNIAVSNISLNLVSLPFHQVNILIVNRVFNFLYRSSVQLTQWLPFFLKNGSLIEKEVATPTIHYASL